MKHPRVRFGLRWLLVAVALAALALGGERMWRRRHSLLAEAAPYAVQQAFYTALDQALPEAPGQKRPVSARVPTRRHRRPVQDPRRLPSALLPPRDHRAGRCGD